ncbi:MAG: asparaginyl/glutamyl-tRNA amidotransferase subunit C [Gammaproteobacteria bacterium RIFCSPLOWO2_02_FULL_38_11]|nr:MAG: asparaginyl/glutamyl-tRNA amidotransferase subunit C [Gammaproteobacteria bacterium RIFCSPHIGHO2_02_FULL_38_33]OGT23847.1 MAG: asparaginyl/glutamyl-tRNA amidotransferase subunit C [Gammaproteobacteria bacterium RIFCSPHIGHO2_12_38_15]OGT69146.1 MAG: asparaginyl/glutamyl-tRNA amidotransferase subunit C [Gammaproteobacteria bacterium RIFCSPLOWO2_02_FULL_38_11]OGT77285.1 MAG: asparaginyl/glutamyl-tRNA amidotransferase subunit C [Gammaproteobacteria bacterium RIFCSPLOWO2_12_FULL_38_14]
MSLTFEEVKKIAFLARLHFKEEEIAPLTQKLSTIFDMVAQMESVNTSMIEPLSHPLDLHQRLREDEVSLENQRDLFQSIAPLVIAGLYLVPQVIE